MANEITIVQANKQLLTTMKTEFLAALPKHINIDKFMRVAQTAWLSDPDIMKLEKMSVIQSLLKSAQDGLLPDKKEAAIVPFKGKATYMPMVGGILKKMRNSGDVAGITAQLVYEKDFFEYVVDHLGERLSHKPDFFAERGDIKGVYAQAILKDGTVYIEVMNMTDINAIKGASASKYGPWSGPFHTEMMKKSVIRRLSKRLPMSTDLENTLHSDDQFYDFNKEDAPVKSDSTAESTATPNLNEAMNISKPDVEVESTSGEKDPNEI